MSAKIFKNFKHAKRHLPKVFLCIQAVDKELKRSYLWDAFTAATSEIQSYVEELHLLKLVDHRLKVLSIDDTVFVAHYENLKLYLDNFSFTSIDVVNVSQTLSLPYVMGHEEKIAVLEPILKCSRKILEAHGDMQNLDYTSCNPCTLFGILLGYPVLYWFSHQPAHLEFKCLAMLPLKVHKIVTDVSLPDSFPSKMYFSSVKGVPACHELFKFSIPENVSKETEFLVENWFHMLMYKSKSNTVFHNLAIKTNVIALPTVSM